MKIMEILFELLLCIGSVPDGLLASSHLNQWQPCEMITIIQLNSQLKTAVPFLSLHS